MVNLDRFNTDVIDDRVVVGECAQCDREIYVGDEVVTSLAVDVVHSECWTEYCYAVFEVERGVIDSEGNVN